MGCICTPCGLGAVWAAQHLGGILLPRVLHRRFKDDSVVKLLQGTEVVPQVLYGFDVILLLCGKDGGEGLQLGREREREK